MVSPKAFLEIIDGVMFPLTYTHYAKVFFLYRKIFPYKLDCLEKYGRLLSTMVSWVVGNSNQKSLIGAQFKIKILSQ